MPNKNDIIVAVKNSDKFLKISELQGATIKLKSDGSPYFFTGGFTMVFQLEKQSKKWAFRIWHTPIQNEKERFQKISQYLFKQKLSYFADFIYDEKGLLINGEWVDTIRMEWLDGLLLKDYIEQNLQNKPKILQLAEDFLTMCKELHEKKISHGDLQHGNIIIDKNENIRLIDYDSICVPDIEGQEEYVTGLKGYQHPSRINSTNYASLKADYFSELVIYLSIITIAEKPILWDDFQVQDSEELLFNENDLGSFKQSKIYNELRYISSSEIDDLLDIMLGYLEKPSYLDLEPFYSYLTLPEIVQFSVDKNVVISGQEIALSWQVNNAREVTIKGIGKVNNIGSNNIYPNQNSHNYLLIATNNRGKVEQNLEIKIFPTPIIESLKVPMPDFESRINLSLINISSPKIDTHITIPDFNMNFPDFNISVPTFIEPTDRLLKRLNTNYKPKKSIFNFSKIYEYIRRKNRG